MRTAGPPSLSGHGVAVMDTWPVVRSPSDVLRLVVAAVLLVVLLLVQWLWGRALVDFTGELFAGLSAVPTWLVDVIVIVTASSR